MPVLTHVNLREIPWGKLETMSERTLQGMAAVVLLAIILFTAFAATGAGIS